MLDQNRESELREAIELFFFAYRSFTAEPDRILARRGLNRLHHRILYFVGRDQGLSVNDLLSVLQISKQALHMPMRQLISMQLVTRARSSQDGRVRELRLTAEGRRLESRLTGTQILLLEQVFSTADSFAGDLASDLDELADDVNRADTTTTSESGWRRTMRVMSES